MRTRGPNSAGYAAGTMVLMRSVRRSRAMQRMRPISFRLTDQFTWSGGYFLFNMSAAFAFPMSVYAAVTVSSTMGLIAAMCVRSYALDGRLVAGTRAGVALNEMFSAKVAWVSSVVGGSSAGILTSLWIWLSTNETPSWTLPVLSITIVLADAPHYLLTMKRAYNRALIVGSLYLLGGMLAIVMGRYFASAAVMLIWMTSTLVCTFVGWMLVGQSTRQKLVFPYRHISRRMGAESLYSALGGQLGIFLIYLTSDPSATTGIRLAYSLVFAPAFMLIQGLTPLYLMRMSDLYRRPSEEGVRLSIYWISGACSLLAIAGASGFAAAHFELFGNTKLEASVPYLVPVGLSIMGAIVFDAALLNWRFRVSPTFPHRARLGTVGVDLAVQVTGVLVAGPLGLVVALISTAALKVAFASFIILKLRNRTASPLSST